MDSIDEIQFGTIIKLLNNIKSWLIFIYLLILIIGVVIVGKLGELNRIMGEMNG